MDYIVNNTFVVGAGISVSCPLLSGPTISVDFGVSRTISVRKEESTFVSVGASASAGIGLSKFVSFSYTMGILPNYQEPSDYAGWSYNYGFDYFLLGTNVSGWGDDGITAYKLNASTNVDAFYSIEYTWDIGKLFK